MTNFRIRDGTAAKYEKEEEPTQRETKTNSRSQSLADRTLIKANERRPEKVDDPLPEQSGDQGINPKLCQLKRDERNGNREGETFHLWKMVFHDVSLTKIAVRNGLSRTGIEKGLTSWVEVKSYWCGI